MITLIFIFTAVWCITILAAARYAFAPVPTGLIKRDSAYVHVGKSRSGYVGKSHPSPKLARSISLGLLLAIQRSVRKI